MASQDQELLTRLQAGDSSALAEVFESYADRLYRLALRLLDDETEAEGAVQDTFMRLIEGVDQFEGRSSLGTWLYRVTHNLCIDRLRRRRRLQPLDEEAEDEGLPVPAQLADWAAAPESLFEAAEADQQVAAAIAALPLPLRAVFELRELQGLSTLQTAEALGLSESNVKVRLHRARLLLRESLARYFSERLGEED